MSERPHLRQAFIKEDLRLNITYPSLFKAIALVNEGVSYFNISRFVNFGRTSLTNAMEVSLTNTF